MATVWEVLARQMGYDTEKAMWEKLYATESIAALARKFDCSPGTVRNRIQQAGVPMKSPGGANHVTLQVDDALVDDITKYGVRAAAKIRKVRPQVIYQRLYYKLGITVRELRRLSEDQLQKTLAEQRPVTQREGDPPSSTDRPKEDHEPQS